MVFIGVDDFKKLPIIQKLAALSSRLASGDTSELIKRELGITRYELCHLRRLDKRLTEATKCLIHKHGLSEGHAKALARLSGNQQDNLLKTTIQKRWSVRELEQAVRAHLEGGEFTDRSTANLYYEQLSEYISEQIGHPVKIQPGKDVRNGQITVTYYGLDAFDGILKRMRIKMPED